MQSTTLTVPAEHRDAFQQQAAFTLECAAEAVHDTLSFRRERDENLAADPVDDERAHLRAASDLWDRVIGANGKMQVTGEQSAVRETVKGCVLVAGSNVHGECERLTPATIRERIAELEFWLSELDRIEGEAA
jgi:hypothetical protein